MRWPWFLPLAALNLSFAFQPSLSTELDSLQMRIYHGLDEIGVSQAFYLDFQAATLRTLFQSSASALYRRPPDNSGNLKTEGIWQGEIGKKLSHQVELLTLFEASHYRYQQLNAHPSWATWGWNLPLAPTLVGFSTAPPSPPPQINRALLGLGGSFQPDSVLLLSTVLGPRWDHREGYEDQGLGATLNARLDHFSFGGYESDVDLFLEEEKLDHRRNRELRVQCALFKQFSGQSSNRLSASFRQKKYDYHLWGTPTIGTRLDSDQSLQDQWQYRLHPRMELTLDLNLTGSQHEDRTANANFLRKEIRTLTAVELHSRWAEVTSRFKLKFDWGNQDDATGLKRERGTSLEGGLGWAFTPRDSLDFTSAVRKRQYDTFDPANFDDRDRLRFEFDLYHEHVFDPHFRFSQQVDVTLEHLVYIYSAKSDQNNWNRIFKLTPAVYFEPTAGISNLARFELAANLTDYDFELDPTNLKSTIYRRYTASDSLGLQLSKKWRMVSDYAVDLEDGGRLIWTDWIELISDEYLTQRGLWRWIRQTRSSAEFSFGLQYYQRQGWEYTQDLNGGNVRTPSFLVSRWGPLLQFTYPARNGFWLDVGGDLSWVHEWGKEDYTLVNFDMRFMWR